MARVNKGEVIQKIVKGLRLDSAREPIPLDVIERIMPVFVVNEQGEQRTISVTAATPIPFDFVVPANKRWEVESLWFTYTASATVGVRVIIASILNDSGFEVFRSTGENTMVATQVARFAFSQYYGTTDTFSSLDAVNSFPKHIPAGWTIRVDDRASVDSADTFTGALNYLEMEQTED